MRIEFFDLLATDGWEPVAFDQSSRSFLWGGEGSLAAAPIDLAATLDGAMWRSSRVDADFNMGGVRWRPNFTVPWHSHNMRQLNIVLGGGVTVDSEDGSQYTVKSGEFWISDANSKQTFTTGPEGVSYVETWPVWVQLYTTWHPADGWVTR